MAIPPFVSARRLGSEPFKDGTISLGFDLLAFWQWYGSDLVSNATRGCLAEFIVAKALGASLVECRDEWAAYDCLTPSGIKIEVKSSAYLQAWSQKKVSTPTFAIGKRKAWNKDTGAYSHDPLRSAHVYVFALLAHQEKSTLDPMDVGQWRFYVLPSSVLEEKCSKSSQIGLSGLDRLGAKPLTFSELPGSFTSLLGETAIVPSAPPSALVPAKLVEYAQAACRNSQEKATAANGLFHLGHHATAVALLVTAIEELGKARYAFYLGIGAANWKYDTLDVLRRRHATKQIFTLILPPPGFQRILEEVLTDAMASIPPATTDLSADAVEQLRKSLESRLEALKVGSDEWAGFTDEIKATWKRVIDNEELEKLRQLALYVDIDPDSGFVTGPSAVQDTAFQDLNTLYQAAWKTSGSEILETLPSETLTQLRAVIREWAAAGAAAAKRTPGP